MAIPLFGEYKTIAPKWWSILQRDEILDGDREQQLFISDHSSCFVGEVYLLGKAKYSECSPCRRFSLIFYYLIKPIAQKAGIYRWSTPVSEWVFGFRTNVTNLVNEYKITPKEAQMILKMFDYYKSNIEVYRDLFNCFANNYLQHLSQCETYVENVAIVR